MASREYYCLSISGGPRSLSIDVLYTEKAKPYVDKIIEAVNKVDPTITFQKGRATFKNGGDLEEDMVLSDVMDWDGVRRIPK